MKFIGIAFFIILGTCFVKAQINAAGFNPYGSFSAPIGIYVGEVKGYDKKIYDSIYRLNTLYAQKEYLLTESKHKIEIRLSCWGGFPGHGLAHDFLDLYYDSIVEARGIDCQAGRGYIIKMPKNYVNADSVYNKLIENGIFNLPDFDELFGKATQYLHMPQNSRNLDTIHEIRIDDGIGCTLEYKVGNKFRIIHFPLAPDYLEEYPDNQISRRYDEIFKVLGVIQ